MANEANITSLCGLTMNDSNYRAVCLNLVTMPGARPVFLDMPQADSVYTGAYTVDVRNLAVFIEIIGANKTALGVQLRKKLKRGTSGEMILRFFDDGRLYQVSGVVQAPIPDPEYDNVYTVILQAGRSNFIATAADTYTGTLTGTGSTFNIAIAGNDNARISVTLTPRSLPVSTWAYSQLVKIENVPGKAFPRKSIAITINTAALFGAGKIRSDCFDLMVMVNGTIVNRQVAKPNNAATLVWLNLPLAAGFKLNLLTPIVSTGDITTLEFQTNATHKKFFKKLPAQGMVYHGTEWISYRGIDRKNCKLTVRERGTQGTTRQTHAAADVFTYLQYAVWVYYGKAGAVNPATLDEDYNNLQPLYNLELSDNTKVVVTNTDLFYDPARPGVDGSWYPLQNNTSINSEAFTVQDMAVSGAPSLGAKAAPHNSGPTSKADNIKFLGWGYDDPACFKTYSFSIKKIRSTGKWFTFAGLQRSVDGGKTWQNVFSEATPGSTGVAATNSYTSQNFADQTADRLRFGVMGTSDTIQSSYANLQGLTLTLEFATANVIPVALFGAERSNFHLDLYFVNNTTATSLRSVLPLLIDTPFVIDGQANEATYGGVNFNAAIDLDDDSRAVWVPGVPGTNSITIYSPDLGTLDYSITVYPEHL